MRSSTISSIVYGLATGLLMVGHARQDQIKRSNHRGTREKGYTQSKSFIASKRFVNRTRCQEKGTGIIGELKT
jgi:hypothetical protein